MIVDVHAHIVTSSIVEAAKAGTELCGVEYWISPEGRMMSRWRGRDRTLPWPDFEETIERRLTNMDEAGVDAHALSLSPSLINYEAESPQAVRFAQLVNDEIAEVIDKYPNRFYGFGHVPLQDVKASVKELRRVMELDGFIGIVLGTNEETIDFDDDSVLPLFEAAAETRALVFVHPTSVRDPGWLDRYHMRNLIGNPLATTVAFTSMVFGGVLDRLPSLQLCLAHGGGYACLGIGRMDHGFRVHPETASDHLPSHYLGRTYVDSLVHDESTLRLVLDRIGADRVLLASDYPADMGQPDPVEWIRQCSSLSQQEKEAILGGNFAVFLNQRTGRS